MILGISSELQIDPRVACYVNDNLADYLVPVNADILEVALSWSPKPTNFVNSVGAKGIGELGNVGTASAVDGSERRRFWLDFWVLNGRKSCRIVPLDVLICSAPADYLSIFEARDIKPRDSGAGRPGWP